MKPPVCKLPVVYDGDPPIESCGTVKGVKICAGDRVERLPVRDGGKLIKFKHKGTVMGVSTGRDNRGKKGLAARVCFDDADPGDMAYSYLFSEIRPVKK